MVEHKPQAVHLMAGTNDLAALRRPYDGDETRKNIDAMAMLAKDHGIRVIIASVPTASGFRWGKPAEEALKSLNGGSMTCAPGMATHIAITDRSCAERATG